MADGAQAHEDWVTPEIRAFEYALGLVTILIGLAVADIATSFHRLVRTQAAVTWDPLALLAALFALCMSIGMWFDLWAERDVVQTRHFLFYLSVVAQLFVLFLVAASSLPDELGGSNNLKEYYAKNHRYFWSLVALYWLGYLGHGIYFVAGSLGQMPRSAAVEVVLQMAAPFLITSVLLFLTSRKVHYVGLGLLFAWMFYYYGGSSIS